mmetsp:Transcript_35493/g.89430  ORF Transcript_35493/g.89430 Transcript_35493/m.89430 type:complete len:164 (-) Transcript_35493:288-779(-)|eukprot:CAMPEP_0115281600 /NCGR_PEP_ID=MMETSP0270-20121206/59407_1 /TAXON_ID=71861 /ORGANISM="Scrippsiella trochoidea, Strain CCMP3099" /LENGTH=163 /DNA_ID=CAMNT_0002698413 /DNA_START=77 /DNA_END=568 /DNA_ORIENTATION=-
MGGGASKHPTLLTGSEVDTKGAHGKAVLTVCAASVAMSKEGKCKPRLLKVHRRPEGVTLSEEVPVTRSSLTAGDSFVLDAGEVVYLWSGPNASTLKRAVANEIATGIERERDGRAALSIPHGPSDRFWCILDGQESLDTMPPPSPVASEGQEDDDDEDDYAWI